jgi:pimeloyl-ACP methyl ester carboxylesterase
MDQAATGVVRPFRIEIPDETLADLDRRLQAARLIEFPLTSADAGLGLDRTVLRHLLEYWRDVFDWRRVERELNRFRHVLLEVDGLDVHAVHVRGHGPSPLPLLVSHGWPSSFAEILPAVDLMTRPGDFGGDPADAFDVVIASLPGYTFSAAPVELADAGAPRMAARFHGLMTALGYERYGASGGDIAARVAAWMGAQQPAAVLGLHLSCNAITPPIAAEAERDAAAAEWLAREQRWWDQDGGYEHIQRTRPRTLAAALDDSPVGAAAWMVEKWSEWADDAADPIARFGADELLTHVMLHWCAGTVGSSVLTYTAAARDRAGMRPPPGAVTAPAGFYLSEAEPHGIPPRTLAERQYRVAQWSVLPRGGHFLPTEEPELYVDDLREFFRPLRRSA